MAQKLLKRKPHKVAPKKAQVEETGRAGAPRTPSAVLVGTYKAKQLSWIKRHGIYNYPVKDGDEFDEKSFASIKELWLYADVKGTRHVFEAEFIGIKTREELISEYGYPSGILAAKNAKSAKNGRARTPTAPHGSSYYVFKAKYLEYGTRLDDPFVIARTADFGGRSAKVKKAIEQFKTDGEFAPLEHYLPSDLAKVPRNRLRVCEAAVQYYFWDMPGLKNLMPAVPFPPPAHPKFTFIDLFAGIGGFRLAMQAQGGRCVFSSEWNKYAQKTYEANFGEVPYGDITTEDTKAAIPEHFDVLCAGFPCQPFSIAGVSKKKSLGRETGFRDKTQGTLFFDVADIISRHRPKAFFLENVKNLVSHDKGNTFRIIRETLEELDYSIHYRVMDGQEYVPQHRERIMIVGFDKRIFHGVEHFEFPKATGVKHRLSEILESSPDAKYTLSDKLWNYLQNYAVKHQEKGNGFGFGMASLDGVTRTLSARYYKDGSEILVPQGNGINPRRLTPHECARLMGYPPNYRIDVVSDVQAYRQCGNSVVVPLITAVSKKLVEVL